MTGPHPQQPQYNFGAGTLTDASGNVVLGSIHETVKLGDWPAGVGIKRELADSICRNVEIHAARAIAAAREKLFEDCWFFSKRGGVSPFYGL